LQCAGLLGKQIKEVNLLPRELIINPFYGAYLYSPTNHILKVAKEEPEAFVVDRVGYDQFLADKAVDSGAELYLKHRLKDLNTKNGQIYLKNGEDFTAKIIVGADGNNSVISRKISKSYLGDSLQAAQLLVDFQKDIFNTRFVHLHAYASISPGFIWMIPLSESTARVGLFGDYDYQVMVKILKDYLDGNSDYNGYKILKKYHGMIPVYNPKKKILENNVILLGDAASQVKPTTGGGLIMGFKCAQIAADVAERALINDDIKILKDYESLYHKNFKNELKSQLMVQKIFKSLSDDDLDFMFLKLKEEGAEDLISRYGEMDDQSPLIKEMFKRGLLFKILPIILARTITGFWK
jgi:geranylgeranyl reductase family protein